MRNPGIKVDEYPQAAFLSLALSGPRIAVRGDKTPPSRAGWGRLQVAVLLAVGAGRQAGDPFEEFAEYRL